MLLFAIWAAVILLFFSFSTRQEYYAIPALPALALLIGGWLQQEDDSPADSFAAPSGRIGSLVLLVVSGVVFVAAMFLLVQSKSTPADSDLADLLKKNPNEYALAFGHIFDLTPRALGLFRVPLAIVSDCAVRRHCAESACTGGAISPTPATGCLTIMMVFVLFAVHQGLVMFSPILSSKKLADAIEQEFRPGDVHGVLRHLRRRLHIELLCAPADPHGQHTHRRRHVLWIAVSRCAGDFRRRRIAAALWKGRGAFFCG